MVSTSLAAAAALLLAAGAAVASHEPGGTRHPPLPAGAPVRAVGTQVAYRWPTGGPAEVVRPFDRPGAPWTAGHRGVDLRLAPGSPVLAAASGRVMHAAPVAGRGVVSVLHSDGVRTTYEPVVAAVEAGDVVEAGAVLGRLEAAGSHCAPGGCLHWGARRGPHDYIDPLTLLHEATTVRLDPAP